MINVFKKRINPQEILSLQNHQYQEKLLLADTVPANSTKLGKVNISSLGAFYCLYMTGTFDTLTDDGGTIKDNGVNGLKAFMSDGSNQRSLFNDYIPLDLFLTPGRQKSNNSAAVLTDAPGETLFYPQQFQYMFTVNSEILFNVKNDSNTELSYAIAFQGIRIKAGVKGGR